MAPPILPIPSDLLPGDLLLYSRRGWFNWAISVKTWSPYTHVEVMGRRGRVYASRNGEGCGHYGYDPDGLALVLRPDLRRLFSIDQAAKWFLDSQIGQQGYDYLGLLNFFYARQVGRSNGRMFCSEFATRFLRAGGLDLFPGVDADTISPRDFTLIGLGVVWAASRGDAEAAQAEVA